VTHREDTGMDRLQRSAADPVPDRTAPKPDPDQLPLCDDAVLAAGHLRELARTLTDFCTPGMPFSVNVAHGPEDDGRRLTRYCLLGAFVCRKRDERSARTV
jgi:hypothetical protein